MTAISNALITKSNRMGLRPLDINRDLPAVADLVEMCFSDSMDLDGQRYLRQMRDAGQNSTFIRWASTVADQASLPLSGFVWEENQRLIGNVSVIPFTLQGERLFLVANVAVHPDFRRQGIGRALTAASLDYIRKRKAASAWLHVREDNGPAVRIYQSLGFEERARRTTWQSAGQTPEMSYTGRLTGISVTARQPEHWADQRQWLSQLYPPHLSWHLPINLNLMRTGPLGSVYRFFSGTALRQWSAQKSDQLLGVVAWQRYSPFTDSLWLAIPPKVQPNGSLEIPSEETEIAVRDLLAYARRRTNSQRALTLDFPARLAARAIQGAGFVEHQTLIWMEARFKP